jgi:hypothetical protein
MFNNFEFRTNTQSTDVFAEVHSLSTVAKALGADKAGLGNKGNGNFVILTRPDGTHTTIRASKLMKDEHLATAQVGLLKDLDADGKKVYIAIRPAGESSVVSKWVTFD